MFLLKDILQFSGRWSWRPHSCFRDCSLSCSLCYLFNKGTLVPVALGGSLCHGLRPLLLPFPVEEDDMLFNPFSLPLPLLLLSLCLPSRGTYTEKILVPTITISVTSGYRAETMSLSHSWPHPTPLPFGLLFPQLFPLPLYLWSL